MESRVEEIMDSRLSSLPDDIIHKILSTVSMKDIVKTSVLSSRWRYIWTSMPYLNFSDHEFCKRHNHGQTLPKLTQFVIHVLTRRNNQVPVSYVKLDFYKDVSSWFTEKTMMQYILSHNVQQLDVKCRRVVNDSLRRRPDDSDLWVTLFSSESLNRLSLTPDQFNCGRYLTTSLTLELPALTTLYLSYVKLYGDENTLFSKCPNLKYLTLKSCTIEGLDSLSICHHRLSDLTLDHDMMSVKVLTVVAPQLNNLTIRYHFEKYHETRMFDHPLDNYYRYYLRKYKHVISAPNLISLTYEGYDPLPLSTDGFHSLEKVDLCICNKSQGAAEALETVRLFQQIRSVKFLTLNLEILELLSSYVQVISHQPPPFANLKSLYIYPKMQLPKWEIIPNVSTEVKNYLLDSSRGATFTMVSHQEAKEDRFAEQARYWMANLQRYLGREKDIIETNRDHLQQPTEKHDESMYNDDDDDDDDDDETETQMQLKKLTKQIDSCWTDHRDLISRGNQIVNSITHRLRTIKWFLTNLPTSKRAMLQPCFSSLCAETKIFVSKMTERIKIHNSESLSNANDHFHEFATSLQSSS